MNGLESSELESQDEILFISGAEYEGWSPYDSASAAQTLMKMLEEDEST